MDRNTPQYLAGKDRVRLDAELSGSAAPRSDFVGLYPPRLKNILKGKEVIALGGGEVYQQMLGPALNFLGVQVHLYDTNPETPSEFGENRLESSESGPARLPVFILSPNRCHLPQAEKMIEQERPVAVEKPACLFSEIQRLTDVISTAQRPSYWTDFNFMMARVLIALASGVKMPFMDAVSIESDPAGKVRESLLSGTPLVQGKIVRVTGHFLQKGQNTGGTLQGREWLNSLEQGGGMMRDLLTRMLNICSMIGMNVASINDVDLRVSTPTSGQYVPIKTASQAEHFAKTSGMMDNGAEFCFTVGKYAAKDNLNLVLDYDTGVQLKLEWCPPNRKNKVIFCKNGEEAGRVGTYVDPYLLTSLFALQHFESNELAHLFFPEQIRAVQVIGEMAFKGRGHLHA